MINLLKLESGIGEVILLPIGIETNTKTMQHHCGGARIHPFYRRYPLKGVANLGARKGYFDNLVMYVGMAYDTSTPNDLYPLCTNANDNLLVWSEQTMSELKSRGGNLQRLQLDAVAYLWELCYDLLLASDSNVSVSPGFEALGLRVNRAGGKRKRNEEKDKREKVRKIKLVI